MRSSLRVLLESTRRLGKRSLPSSWPPSFLYSWLFRRHRPLSRFFVSRSLDSAWAGFGCRPYFVAFFGCRITLQFSIRMLSNAYIHTNISCPHVLKRSHITLYVQ